MSVSRSFANQQEDHMQASIWNDDIDVVCIIIYINILQLNFKWDLVGHICRMPAE